MMPKQVCLTPYRCDTCNSYFKRKGDLTRHVKLHKGIRSYVCQICTKPFSQQSGLKTHLNVHSGEKPYACNFDDCPAVFGDPSSAARHRKETHRRLGAYRCPIPGCGSSIKRRSAFAHHLRKHAIDPDDYDIDSLAPPLLPVIPMPSRDGGKVIFVPGANPTQKTRRRRSLIKPQHHYLPQNNPFIKLPAPPASANTPPTSASDVDWEVDTQTIYNQALDHSPLHSYQDIYDMKQGFEFLDMRDPNESHSCSPSLSFNTSQYSSLPLFFTDVMHSDSAMIHPLEVYDGQIPPPSHYSLGPPSSKQHEYYEPSAHSKDQYHYSKELNQTLYFSHYADGQLSSQVSDSKTQQRSCYPQDAHWSSVAPSSGWVHSG
ncbi:hypothetical protein BJ165DRAFT_92456 [Panaeolus papilionaceus]|nr:hypothetical protein BJ165DRAFT_92456 [Panaeolus papilionaceus]